MLPNSFCGTECIMNRVTKKIFDGRESVLKKQKNLAFSFCKKILDIQMKLFYVYSCWSWWDIQVAKGCRL